MAKKAKKKVKKAKIGPIKTRHDRQVKLGARREDRPQAKCFNCPALVDAENQLCHGCGAVVCDRCDKNVERIGMGRTHRPEQHLEDPGEGSSLEW